MEVLGVPPMSILSIRTFLENLRKPGKTAGVGKKPFVVIFPCWFQKESITTGHVYFVQGAEANGRMFLGVPPISVLSILLSREPPETRGKRRSVFEKTDG